MDPRGAQITAWAPGLAGITEVFHADFVGHAYPKHTHDQWSLMLVDRGTIAYDLDHRARPDGESLEAESRLGFLSERLNEILTPATGRSRHTPTVDERVADQLRDLLDARLTTGITMREASNILQRNPTYLIKNFAKHFGLPPHKYVTGRRIDLARRAILAGRELADVAVDVGFHDQSHLSRHFVKHVGAPPGKYSLNVAGGAR
ncbi:helix-turn-helix domain-containing protein [Rhodococcus qingshengii]|uniref:helix-turn-helix domain-containing protein n=1 Tax=Rhodococcus qingshengii TaxID=334542 RepID=UPI00364BDC5C